MNLIETCQYLGEGIRYVQGPGGNVSLKTKQGMRIKSSGCTLREVTDKKGHLLVDYHRVQQYMDSLEKEIAWSAELEREYIELLVHSRLEPVGRPSIETGFHAILSSAVVHTHPLVVNAFLCSKDGPDRIREIFPNAIIIPYKTVGVVLSKAIALSEAEVDDDRPIFLINHGLITHASTLDRAVQMTNDVLARLEEELVSLECSLPDEFTSTSSRVSIPFLFPDSVVYPASTQETSSAAQENSAATNYILHAASKLGGPVSLSDTEVKILQSMLSEKFRQQQASGQ